MQFIANSSGGFQVLKDGESDNIKGSLKWQRPDSPFLNIYSGLMAFGCSTY